MYICLSPELHHRRKPVSDRSGALPALRGVHGDVPGGCGEEASQIAKGFMDSVELHGRRMYRQHTGRKERQEEQQDVRIMDEHTSIFYQPSG